MPRPKLLEGTRVLDLSRVLAGPWCSQILADYGADVIKVERPGTGDDTRAWGPPWWGEGAARQAAYYLCTNRGKRSVAIDYPRLAALNPTLVYCSITGYGQDGPYAHAAGYDFAIQATGGLMSITGEKDGTPGSQPQKVGVAVADLFTGVYACTAILAALAERHRTGNGRWIDAALLDTQVAMLANQASNYLVGGKTPKRMGNAHVNIAPYQVFATRDGYIVLAVGNDAQFARFCALCGQPETARDPRFATNEARVQHRDELIAILAPWMSARTTAEWTALLEPNAVPCAPILEVNEVFRHPQVVARGMQIDRDGMPMVATPMRSEERRVGKE